MSERTELHTTPLGFSLADYEWKLLRREELHATQYY
jgi:hypothetical protein